jgi:hypothetical protein
MASSSTAIVYLPAIMLTGKLSPARLSMFAIGLIPRSLDEVAAVLAEPRPDDGRSSTKRMIGNDEMTED